MNALVKSAEWHAERRQGIGGSDAAKIMAGDWLDLWLEKTGRKEPEDLSRNLAVQMGTWTETLNRHWFQQEAGIPVDLAAAPHVHPVHSFMRCNLDGICAGPAVWEAKHVSAFAKGDEVVNRYFLQLQHNMAVTGWAMAYLSVFFGNAKWAYWMVDRDEQTIAELTAREAEFWSYVMIDEMPPQKGAAPVVEIAFDQMREVDMTESNFWADQAAIWLRDRAAAKAFESATKELKGLVEADVKRAHGHGINVTRAANGSLTIREMK